MYTRKVFKTIDMALWTRYETLFFVAIGIAFVSLYVAFAPEGLYIPWTPMALIGTAVAFVIGFQNNSAYGRIWEARKIWGGIVNASRTFGVWTRDMVTGEYADDKPAEEALRHERQTLIYRHIAWLTALRYAMREPRPWETVTSERANKEWSESIRPPEYGISRQEAIKPYLAPEEQRYIDGKDNKPAALLYLQSSHLRRLKEKGWVWEFSFLELEGLLQTLFDLQGKSERIKNFPYPRHFASLNHYFMWLFVLLLPMAITPQFAEIGNEIKDLYPILGKAFIWFSIPFYVAVAWIFHTMERIGRTGENPFEGSANDIPISTMSRNIERELLQHLDDPSMEVPDPRPVVYDTQM